MKMLISIPAYNEEKMIGTVLSSLPKTMSNLDKIDVLVVDDGSTDKTAGIASFKKVKVLKHLINRGLGGALKTIFAFAKINNYDILVTLDADGQHDIRDLPSIVNPIINKKSDIVIGTRWKDRKKIPFTRFIVNILANFITYLFFGVWISDSQSGFRSFNRKAIAAISLQTDGMEVSSEIFREIYRNKLRFTEVPIHVIYTEYSKSKGQRLSNAPNVFFQLLLRLLR